MEKKFRVAVASSTFTNHPQLMDELYSTGLEIFPNKDLVKFKEKELINFLQKSQSEIAIIALEPITNHVLQQCTSLKMISKYGVGTDNLDLDEIKHKNIHLGWTPGVNKRSVSELVLAFALGHCRNVISSVHKMHEGIWEKKGGYQLSNLTFGIVGLGHIGTDLAKLLKAFGCEVIFNDIIEKNETSKTLDLTSVSFKELLKLSDVISFHVPLTTLTKNMFSKQEILQTKKSALIINTARGDIIDFDAVVQAVKEKKLGGFASDVFPVEPFDAKTCHSIPNLYFTPHIGGNSKEAVLSMGRATIDHIRRYIELKLS